MDLIDRRFDSIEKRINDVESKLTTRIDNLYNLFAGFLYNKKDDSAA